MTKLRFYSLLLLVGMAEWGSSGPSLFAQGGPIEKPGKAPETPSNFESWSTDFWPRWPEETDPFRDCYAATWSDALVVGYFLDPRSLSPDGHYGVLIPRFGVVREGPNFLVEVPQRRIVGALEGKGFAFPAKAAVGWSYRWAADDAALVIEQAGESRKDFERVNWQLVEIRDGYIAKQTDLLKNAGKIPSWLDKSQAPTHDRTEPPVESPVTLARSSAGEDAWTVLRDGARGPLRMNNGGAPAGTLPPVRAMGADAQGAVRELRSDAMPGLPLSFFSLDERWLFVNQIARVDPGTGAQWRTGVLYHRDAAADGKTLEWKLALPEFDEAAWKAFVQQSKVPAESAAPPDTAGFRDRTIEFVNWSPNSGRMLLYLRARHAGVTDKAGRPAYYRWYFFFDVKKLAFETTIQIDGSNEDLRTRWNTADESLAEPKVHVRAENPGDLYFFGPTSAINSFADDDLNKSYRALLERVGPEAAEETRRKQRAWLGYRETLARIHALDRWSSFAPEALLHEGRFLATHLQAEVLRKEAVEAHPAANTVLREKSPDGKFGVVYTYTDEDVAQENRPEYAELVALPSRRKIADLCDGQTNMMLKGVWSADSKYLVYHASSRRIAGITIFERRGETFTPLDMPDMDKYGPKLKKGERQYHFDGSDLSLKRWLGPGKMLAHYAIDFDVENETGENQHTVGADFEVVLAIVKGKVVIEKATKVARSRE